MEDQIGPPQKLSWAKLTRDDSRDLRSGQIFMIGISGILGGITIFSTSGAILAMAGPAGVLTTFAAVGLVVIFVMEGLSEMIELWPVSNAMMEFVKSFVDGDLATVVGIAYWYSWSSCFAALIIATAEFTGYWHLAQEWQIFILFILCPLLLMVINCSGVKYYGYIECFGGAFKIILVIGSIVLFYVLAGKGHLDYFGAGFQSKHPIADNAASAVCVSFPIVSYGFLGVDIIAVTAFEARNPKALRFPAKWIAYVAFLLQFFIVLGEVLVVKWNDSSLRPLEQRSVSDSNEDPSVPILLLGPSEASIRFLPGFLAGCAIFCILSGANTALYVASRTLFGLTREIPSNHHVWLVRALSRLGTTTPRTHVPAWALLISAVSFSWLPFLHLKHGYSIQDLLIVIIQTGSVACLLVWASQCLAFIRYRRWLDIHHQNLTGPHIKYNRRRRMEWQDQFSSLLSYFQPAVAWLGLIGCLLIVLVFNSAKLWNGNITLRKFAIAYTAPLVFSLLWLSIKAYKWFSTSTRWQGWYVELSDDWEPLSTVLAHLEWKIEEKIVGSRSYSRQSNTTTLQTVASARISKGAASWFNWAVLRRLRSPSHREVEAEEMDVGERCELEQHR